MFTALTAFEQNISITGTLALELRKTSTIDSRAWAFGLIKLQFSNFIREIKIHKPYIFVLNIEIQYLQIFHLRVTITYELVSPKCQNGNDFFFRFVSQKPVQQYIAHQDLSERGNQIFQKNNGTMSSGRINRE